MDTKKIGKWSFIIGLVICLLAGFIAVPMAASILFVLGLIVGFLNIGAKETERFLIATIALMIVGIASIQALAVLGTFISSAVNSILASFVAFVGASALVVSIKSVLEVSK